MQDDIPAAKDFLTQAQRRALEALGTEVSFPPGDTVFREGQPSRSVVMVKEGNVRILKHAPDGTEIPLATRGVGEILGDEGVLADVVRYATITTITEVIGVDIGARALLDFVDEERLWQAFYRQAIDRRYESDDKRILVAQYDVRERLADHLLDQVQRLGTPEGDDWVVEGASQEELAKAITASREAVAVELRKFRREGLLTTARRKVVLHDLRALKSILPS
ncbi:CRP-like cAMP-binding protein [Kibdelosporangium banguiense]|uniref:CRP-like cAMP-binding protein n=1 Tax=Kibdelosporangium banguiense TaxID=1365924 RepID=A0ABS4T6V3_9PSEU|nr:Crp/Fnr family transcriptional regulator [Kibdelosporangium banguiense]MBP2320145.1 CRP-like cAMP-binding protein [Kibdelosporangium banguiense]